MNNQIPIPENEFDRVLALMDLDLDFTDLESSFADLTKLAAKVAGTQVSLVNLIDSFTQWSVSAHGIELKQMPRESSVCQYTIMDLNSGGFEVNDLSQDDRFKDKDYVVEEPNLKYYYGIPLKTSEGHNLGALCVLDPEHQFLSAEKKEMLQMIGNEIVNRIKIHRAVMMLKESVHNEKQTKQRVAHDIRGPIGGIIGLADIIRMQGDQNKLEEVLEFIALIQKSGKSVLDLADEILNQEFISKPKVGVGAPKDTEFNLETLKLKLDDMFKPQALVKNVELEVNTTTPNFDVPFPKNKVLQIVGNLISNSIKFTPDQGKVTINLDLDVVDTRKRLLIQVLDNGVGMSQDKIDEINTGSASSSNGTSGEKGYGFGLSLVQHLIKGLNGKFKVKSKLGEGTEFELVLPVG